MPDDEVMDALTSSVPELRGERVGCSGAHARWLADVAIVHAWFSARTLWDSLPGIRLFKSKSLERELTLLCYAYSLPVICKRFDDESLLRAPVLPTILTALEKLSPEAARVAGLDRSDSGRLAIQFGREVLGVCKAAGIKKLQDPLKMSLSVTLRLAGGYDFVDSLLANGTISEPEGRDSEVRGTVDSEESSEAPSSLPSITTLTGDALGFEGTAQNDADLCLAFGLAFLSSLTDDGWRFEDESQKSVLVFAGYIAALPVIYNETGLHILTAAANYQAWYVLIQVGFPMEELVDALTSDSHVFLALLARSTGEILRNHDFEARPEQLLQLPTRFAAAGRFIKEGVERRGET